MRLKQMALGTVLLSGLVGAAFGQPGQTRDNRNDNRPIQNNPRPVTNNNNFQRQAPSRPAPTIQRPEPARVAPQAPRQAHTDYRINNNPRPAADNNPFQRGDGNQDNNRRFQPPVQNRPPQNQNNRFNGNDNAAHHTGDPRPSGPVHVGGTIRFQNPNHDGQWRFDNRNDFGGHFSFGLYLFSPNVEPCYVSPWYDYGALPGYVPASSVIVNESDNCQWNLGSVYNYGDVTLDQTVTEVQNMFLNQDQNALNALVPDNGTVGVYTDGGYDYSVSPTEFQQMLSDNAMNVQTIGYRVTQVRKSGNQAIVKAQHTVSDPNGGEDVVYQLFHLQYEDGHYVVTDFMTSHNPI